MRERTELVEKNNPDISMTKQCELLGVARSTVAYKPVTESDEDLRAKRFLDEIFLVDPCLGSRRLVTVLLRDYDITINRKHVQRLRQEMGLEAIWCKPRTSIADDGHRKHPYLLRGLHIYRPNQVWCTDITYVPMAKGSAYLCVVMDWYSRKVLGWAVSNTMDTSLCLKALANALRLTGKVPEIFNTDQGSQFTCPAFIGVLTKHNIKISMDGKGAWRDNVFVERLWKSVKYEEVYLRAYDSVADARANLAKYLTFYNTIRPHTALDGNTPDSAYFNPPQSIPVAA